MGKQDARHLSNAAQEVLRRRAVEAVVGGMRQGEAAKVFGVSRASVNAWVQRWKEGGSEALTSGKRGRPRRPRVTARQAEAAIRAIVGKCPDQLRFPFALWTREAVQMFLDEKLGVRVSVWTVGRYLREWGLTPQKPVSRAFEQNPKEVRLWLERVYPEIRRRARREGAEIRWGDEMGLRSDHQAGRSYGLKGMTPVVLRTGCRFGCNVISAISNRGKMAFMVFRGTFRVEVFLKFLRRLIRLVKGKVFLIVDRHSVHKSRRVAGWRTKHSDRIELFFLPAYSPELNPDELLNQDVKTNSVGRRRPRDGGELVRNVRGYLRGTQRRPDIIRAYFREENVCYAA